MLILWERMLQLGTGGLDEVKGEMFNCTLIYWIIPSLMQTTLGNQLGARDTRVKPDGCGLCLSGGRGIQNVVEIWVCEREKHRLLQRTFSEIMQFYLMP